MTLQQRIKLLVQLGNYMRANDATWQQVKQKAADCNPWFVPEFIEQSATAISLQFLEKDKLEQFTVRYNLPEENNTPAIVGLVMAGNIPLVGFHDMLCIFITGHKQVIKTSAKDEVLIKHLVEKLGEWDQEIKKLITFGEKIAGCEVYIATGSNNTGRYFDYYFGKYPHIIRRNRTSVAIITSNETPEELDKLADDIQTYFGLGCRNVTKLYVPENYNFEPLLKALTRYQHFGDYHKYRHNYDYQLALLMMANKKYMTNGTILLSENAGLFTAISQVNYETYSDEHELVKRLQDNADVQCIIGKQQTPFGLAQYPALTDYADGIDTMEFLQRQVRRETIKLSASRLG